LTLVRFREFWREPEALFWVFIFPILLAAGLGLAFRNRPPEAQDRRRDARAGAGRCGRRSCWTCEQLSAAAAEEALRTGKVALLARPASFGMPPAGGAVVYRYDDTNPEGRTARMLADRAIQRAAGRVDPVESSDR
jgi:ABC-2 type transport system permease protein